MNRGYGSNGLNQVTSSGGAALGYSATGALTLDPGGGGYCYDALIRLSAANACGGSGGAQLSYDALGRLWQVQKGSTTTRFQYDGDQIVAEYDGADHLLRYYADGPGTDEPLVWYEGAAGTGDRRWLIADERGSIAAVTDGTGASLATNTYDEYGLPGSGNLGRFQYTGQAWLPEVGLYDYKARMYSPSLGRFLQPDPIGYADGMNGYTYAHGDPVNGTDPSGMVAEVVVIGHVLHAVPNPIVQVAAVVLDIIGFFFDLFGGGSAAAQPPSHPTQNDKSQNQDQRQNNNTVTCAGLARGLAGNTRLYGKMGAFSKVKPNTAAIIPYQFGGSRKADLRPYVGSINGRLTGVVGGQTVTSTFNSITDVIDGRSPIPGVPVRDALQKLFPDKLIVEVTGGADVGSNASVVLNNYPASLSCPTGTTAQ